MVRLQRVKGLIVFETFTSYFTYHNQLFHRLDFCNDFKTYFSNGFQIFAYEIKKPTSTRNNIRAIRKHFYNKLRVNAAY